jgi:hypothetical protein
MDRRGTVGDFPTSAGGEWLRSTLHGLPSLSNAEELTTAHVIGQNQSHGSAYPKVELCFCAQEGDIGDVYHMRLNED